MPNVQATLSLPFAHFPTPACPESLTRVLIHLRKNQLDHYFCVQRMPPLRFAALLQIKIALRVCPSAYIRQPIHGRKIVHCIVRVQVRGGQYR